MNRALCAAILLSACGRGVTSDADPGSSSQAPPPATEPQKVPLPPASVAASGVPSGIRVVWDVQPGSAEPSEFDVAVPGDQHVLPGTARSAEITGLIGGQQYEVTVFAANAAGRSQPSRATAVAGLPAIVVPPAWSDGGRIPTYAAGGAVAQGRLWVFGPGGVLVSAPLGTDGRPGTWEDSGLTAPTGFTVFSSSSEGGGAWVFAAGNACCGVGTEPTGTISSIELHADGSATAAPQPAIGPVPSVRPGLATDGRHLFALGGFWWSGGSFTGYGTGLPFVYVAEMAGGAVGSWRRTTPLPQAASTVYVGFLAGRLYAVVRDVAGVQTAVHAQPRADGTISAWHATDAPAAFTAAAAVAAGRLYAIGVEDGALFVGSPDESGQLQWSTSAGESIEGSLGSPTLVATDRRLYVIRNETLRTSTVIFAAIDPATGHISSSSPDLAAPTGVRAVAVEEGTVRLAWDRVAQASAYEIRKAGDASGASSTTAAGTSTTITGLDPLVPIRFEVRAVTAHGESRWSASDPVTPWPSSTWRPSVQMGCYREYAWKAGETVVSITYPHAFSAPLDERGLPWSTIGLGGPRR